MENPTYTKEQQTKQQQIQFYPHVSAKPFSSQAEPTDRSGLDEEQSNILAFLTLTPEPFM